jgi:hypothetical protein
MTQPVDLSINVTPEDMAAVMNADPQVKLAAMNAALFRERASLKSRIKELEQMLQEQGEGQHTNGVAAAGPVPVASNIDT